LVVIATAGALLPAGPLPAALPDGLPGVLPGVAL